MTDYAELKKLAEAYFPEKLSVDYTLIGTFDDESLYAFLMHGPKDDDDCVCVDENPDELDGPPSPRLETIAEIVNAFPELLAQNASLKAELQSQHNDRADSLNRLTNEAESLRTALQEAREALGRVQAGIKLVPNPYDRDIQDVANLTPEEFREIARDALRRAREVQGG